MIFRDRQDCLPPLWRSIILFLCGHVLSNKFGLKSAYGIGVGEDRLGVVLRLEARPAGLSIDDERALP
jgi:hypothetical protein